MSEDILSAGTISKGLDTRVIGRKILHYTSLPSTMEAAKKEAARGAPEGTAVVADVQTAGRGRLGRTWLSPEGSISVSVLLHPDIVGLSSLIMIAGLAAARGIEAETGLEARLKWPNDVLIGGRKMAGILVESGLRDNAVDYAVVGVGINVNADMSAYPEISTTATSLSAELGARVSRLKLVRRLLVELDGLYHAPRETVFEEWRSCLVTLGRQLCVLSGDAEEYGRAEGVAEDGSLLLRHEDGSLTRVLAGDVTLRENAGDGAGP